MIVLVIGGSGSGKSSWAERYAAAFPAKKRYYLATMRASDPESRLRAERHRRQRAGLGFETVECPLRVGDFRPEKDAAVLLEDLPNLLANEMFGGGDPERILPDLRALASRCALLTVVTGDVFADGVAYDPMTADYMRRLALLGREIAASADIAVEVAASLPLFLKGQERCAF